MSRDNNATVPILVGDSRHLANDDGSRRCPDMN